MLGKFVISIILFGLTSFALFAQDRMPSTKAEITKPIPSIANGKYGDFDRNTFDLWKPKSKDPTALVIYVHGGGLATGDKEKLPANQLAKMLEAGFAVMAINYRLTPDAVFPQHYMDCARAIQFARFQAREFNVDPKRIGATGSSAGGMTSLWLGFHGDLADPKSSDPVLRKSTGFWYSARPTGTPAQNFDAIPFGLSKDIPAAADFDGDGKTDIGVFRPSSRVWYILGSSNGISFAQFGLGSVRPLPAAYLP